MADAAPDGVFDRQAAQTSGGGPGGEQEGLRPGVCLTDAAAAEAAHAIGGRSAHPTAHVKRLQSRSVLRRRNRGEQVREALEQVSSMDLVHADLTRRLGERLVATVAAHRQLPDGCAIVDRHRAECLDQREQVALLGRVELAEAHGDARQLGRTKLHGQAAVERHAKRRSI